MSEQQKEQVNLESILAYTIKTGSSDIHVAEGDYFGFRLHGHLSKMTTGPKLSREMTLDLVNQLFKGDQKLIDNFFERRDADFAYVSKDGTPFRVNGFHKLGKIGFVMRRIEREAKNMDDLGLPKGVEKVLPAKQGLFLITGPTGSGKSTTMVAIIDRINETRSEHVITIEDPIEFIFKDKQCIFSQREVGRDTNSFVTAIRAAMREDPDIVMVGEMRDTETVEAALNLAETGHLVFSTLHTSGSVSTINRLVQFFSPDIQSQVRVRLGDSLLGVLSQRLVPRMDTGGRVAIHELMYVTSGIKNLIKSGDLVQINNNIEVGTQEGMLSMKKSIFNLIEQGIISPEDAAGYFVNDD
ncbi:MAG: PilT/PilU family type 4a pilus ATPase [Candidatus Gracilibacteria bacterium]|nr:PilT/PilU family type 4a pilus ATPase [Candidatus Gracilibacteria bacterium]MDD3120345.1 PilT/PilU family type 4a pilus ATPase [Candidatus Gracilibacteria bacterium]MDD4530347.1 PilT/PilU family type 4a pilus ATPase [Candidatus Gracilibacteria bacterium]